MINPFNYNEALIDTFVNEFNAQNRYGTTSNHACIYKSSDYPETRQVYLLEIDGQRFAVKVDSDSPETKRLEKEYNLLKRLQPHFESHERVSIIKPVFISPTGKFFVTEFVGRKTAAEALFEIGEDNRAGQIYRRAGEWLHVLHDFKKPESQRFWYQWMFESLDAILQNQNSLALEKEYRPMIEQLHRDAQKIANAHDLKVFSHGDYHGHNLILDRGKLYGLDFTEAKQKIATYDIVDFLKIDIFRNGPAQDIDRSGILVKNKQMFFKLYRHPINMDVLDFCLRARLLIDWLAITPERYKRSRYQRRKFDGLRERLGVAFLEAL